MGLRAKLAGALAAILILVAISAFLGPARESLAWQATPQPAEPPVITSELIGAANPAPVDNPELSLGRVTIMPGAAIPVHFHPGTQIGAIVQGVLTYEVLTGSVELYRAGAASDAPEIVTAGQTVQAFPGDVLVEPPGEIHQGRNEGTVPVVIYLSTLFPEGSPRSIIVEATPTA